MIHESSPRGRFAAFKETLLIYAFDLGGLIAGFILASQLGVFQRAPWAMAVYPVVLGAKGVIHRLLSGRLGVALHLGTAFPRFFKNTESFFRLISATIVMTLIFSVMVSVVSVVFGLAFWGMTAADAIDIVFVIMATMSLGLTLSFVTAKVAFITFERGFDPDIAIYPIMSTIADIFITLCFVLIFNLFFIFSLLGKTVVVTIILMHLALALYVSWKNLGAQEFRKSLQETMLTMVFVSFIVNITGTVLKSVNSILGRGGREVYTAYPALMDVLGDTGSIIGSTATTRLALGLLRPNFSSVLHHGVTIISAWAGSILTFVALAFLSPLVSGTFSLFTFGSFLVVLLVANILAVFGIALLSYGVAILTFQKGLDPDNLVSPIATSFADTLMTIALLVALVFIG